MVSDTLNKIISAEKEAAEKIHAAEKKPNRSFQKLRSKPLPLSLRQKVKAMPKRKLCWQKTPSVQTKY